jgi:RHS repeat-associated protein
MRYSAFGSKMTLGEQNLCNPWRFANRREVSGLSLFSHRFYNPRLMRWQTADPLGFEDGLNLYTYVHNHPFYYKDPDGQFAFMNLSH